MEMNGGFLVTKIKQLGDRIFEKILSEKNIDAFNGAQGRMAKKYDCAFVDNEMPYGRVPQGHPVIVDYFYHEEIRGTENTGKRNR